MSLSPQKWCETGVTRHQPPRHHVSAERLDPCVPRHGAAPAPQLPPHTLARLPQHSSAPALRAPCAPALWLWYRGKGLKCKKREIFLLNPGRSTQAAGLPCPEPIPVISAAKHRPSVCLWPRGACDGPSPQHSFQPSPATLRDSGQSHNERTKMKKLSLQKEAEVRWVLSPSPGQSGC